MITCFVVDDEQNAVDLVCTFIRKVPFLTLAGSTTNPLEALKVLQQQPIDLLFLDIHMPQLSGLDFLRLVKGSTKVVLTTAYSNFAVESFEFNAFDYLLKPIAFERFLKTAQKALQGIATPSDEPVDGREEGYIFVKTESKGKMVRVDFKDIVYIEGMKNYISIYTDTERIVTLLNLKDLEERLPDRHFLRVHKSYIVAMHKIRALDGNQILVKSSKTCVPLGEIYRAAFFEVLGKNVMDGRK